MKNKKTSVLSICCFFFLLLGMFTAGLGPVLPELAGNNHSSLSAIGMVFSGMFFGALVSQIFAGPLGDHIGQQKIISSSLIGMAIGILGISVSQSLWMTLAFSFLAGLGHGGLDLGCNVLIGVIYQEKGVSALNVLNLFYGLGAFAGPALASLSIQQFDSGMPVFWMVSLLMLFSMFIFIDISGNVRIEQPSSKQQSTSSGPSVYRSPLVWVLGLLILIYVGTENGLGGWVTTYMQRTAAMNIENAALVASAFWLALTAGRTASAGLGLRVSSQNILLASLSGAVCGGVLLVFSAGSIIFSTTAILLLGFSFGAVYPTVMAITVADFQKEPGKAVSVVAAMGSIGGAILPWLQGVTLEGFDISSVTWFALGGSIVMLVLLLVSRSRQSLHRAKTTEYSSPTC